jgi:hypothetical protein
MATELANKRIWVVWQFGGKFRESKRKLLDRVRDAVRLKNYSYRTEKAYVRWVKRYILFHQK